MCGRSTKYILTPFFLTFIGKKQTKNNGCGAPWEKFQIRAKLKKYIEKNIFWYKYW